MLALAAEALAQMAETLRDKNNAIDGTDRDTIADERRSENEV